MVTMNSRIMRPALAVLYLCCYAITYGLTGMGVIERFVGHLHQAFWCAALDLAVLWPIYTLTSLSEHEQLGIFGFVPRYLLYFVSSEFSRPCYRHWMQLFVVQGSLSPLPTGTPSLFGDLSTYAAIAQGISYYCIIQIASDIVSGLEILQEAVEAGAASMLEELEEDEPHFKTDYKYLAGVWENLLLVLCWIGLGMLCRFLAQMFDIMGMYLERMAIGALATGCVNAYHSTDPFWRSFVFTVGAILILAAAAAYLLVHVHETWDAEDVRLRMRHAKATIFTRRQARPHQDMPDFEYWDYYFQRLIADEVLNRRLTKENTNFNWAVNHGETDFRRLKQIRMAARKRALDEWEQGEAVAVGDVHMHRRPLAQRLLLRLPRIGPWLPELPNREDAFEMFAWTFKDSHRWLMRWAWLMVELAHLKLPPWRWLARRRWLCPEFAAMWPDDARHDFFASVLAGDQLSAGEGAFLVRRRALRQSEYEDLWRTAGLTTDLVLDGVEAPAASAAAGIFASWTTDILNLPTVVSSSLVSSSLVCVLELCFGICVVIGAIVAYSNWSVEEEEEKEEEEEEET